MWVCSMNSEQPLDYRGLIVWQKAMNLAEEVYAAVKLLPDSERYGMTSQMQRASVSIPCNIAERYGRSSGDFRRHIYIARVSLMELKTQLELCVRLKLIEQTIVVHFWQLAQEVGKMLTALGDPPK